MSKEEQIRKWKQAGIIALWVLMVSGLLLSLAFVSRQQDQLLCDGIDISIRPDKDHFFVDRAMVISLLTHEGKDSDLVGRPVQQINVSALEAQLERNPFVYNAEVYATVNGTLKVKIYQRKPVMRVMNPDGHGYYIDNRGFKMPLSLQYTSRIVVATGSIAERYGQNDSLKTEVTRELYSLACFLEQDEFWKAQIEQVYVNEKGELLLIPKVGSHTIMIGNTDKLKDKMARLMTFYKEALPKTGWDAYSSVNLKYEGQIVCTKNQLNTYEQQ
jgi:cell division protein FtsQ